MFWPQIRFRDGRFAFLYLALTLFALSAISASPFQTETAVTSTTTTSTTAAAVEPTPAPSPKVRVDMDNPDRPVLILPDKEINRRIRKALSLPRKQSLEKVNVKVDDGVVEYDGVVHSLSERNFAEEVIRSTPGVRKVKGHIRVTPSPEKKRASASDPRSMADIVADREIEKRCEHNLARYNLRKTGGVRVKVYLRVAVVSGIVEDETTHRRIIQHVSFTEGVTQVVDLLRISP